MDESAKGGLDGCATPSRPKDGRGSGLEEWSEDQREQAEDDDQADEKDDADGASEKFQHCGAPVFAWVHLFRLSLIPIVQDFPSGIARRHSSARHHCSARSLSADLHSRTRLASLGSAKRGQAAPDVAWRPFHGIWHANCSIPLARDESPPALMTLGTIRSNFKEN